MHPVSLDPVNVDGHTPLSWALHNGREGTARVLLQHGAKLALVKSGVVVPDWAHTVVAEQVCVHVCVSVSTLYTFDNAHLTHVQHTRTHAHTHTQPPAAAAAASSPSLRSVRCLRVFHHHFLSHNVMQAAGSESNCRSGSS
jgi:hypothetical protein